MALQTSGQISLNDIHVQAGGTSGTACNLNDADIRGLTAGSGRTINSSVNTAIEFSDFYGATSIIWNPTMTTGIRTTKQAYFYGYGQSSYGSMNDYSVDFLSNATLSAFRWRSGTNQILLEVYGTHSNSGWTSWTTNRTSNVFNRSGANYTVTAQGATTRWTWTNSNPFGTSGQSTIITFS